MTSSVLNDNAKNAAAMWSHCLQYIKANIDPKPFRTWFEPLSAVKLVQNTLTLQVPNAVYYEYIEEHFIDVLGGALRQQLGHHFSLEYQVQVTPPAQETQDNKKDNLVPNSAEHIKNPFVIPGIKRMKIDSQLNETYRLENFVEGECNKMARSAGIAVSKQPGTTSFNPLIIYGPSGSGKTHLVHAIGNATLEKYPEKNVLYVSSHTFMNQLVAHIKNNTVNDFILFYNTLDVLIIDDIQFFDKKQRMQEIFFTIFNQLHQSHRQIIMTSDKTPKDLEGIEERLLTRFKWGLIADLGTPDIETRMAIMLTAMERGGIAANIEILEYLCYHIDNVRGILGAVNRLKAYHEFSGRLIDMKLAKEIVQHYVSTEVQKEVTIEGIIQLVADYFKTDIALLASKTRKREVVEVRQLAMYMSKKMVNKSLEAIGAAFGGRDHATVIHSCKSIENLIDTDPIFRKTVLDVERKIKLSIGG